MNEQRRNNLDKNTLTKENNKNHHDNTSLESHQSTCRYTPTNHNKQAKSSADRGQSK
jgi:hypothetical protein